MTFGLTGPYKTRYDEYRVIVEDLKRTGFLTVVFVVVLMISFFRSIRAVMLAFLPLVVGIFWTMAFTTLAIGYLNLITAFLLGILFGLGIDFSIHFLVSFADACHDKSDVNTALRQVFEMVGMPLLTSALTTSGAFFSLTISKFHGFKHFGLIAGVGILLCFLSVFYGLPAMIVLCNKMCWAKWFTPDFANLGWKKLSNRSMYRILIVCALFSVYSVTQVGRTNFEYNFENLQEEGALSIVLAERIGEHFGVVLNPVALMSPNRERALSIAYKINRYIETHPDTSFDFAASIASHVPREQEEKIRLMQEIGALLQKHERLIRELDKDTQDNIEELRRQLKATAFTVKDIPDGLKEQYEGKEGNISVVFVYPKSSLLDGQMAKRFVTELRSLDLPNDVILAGEPVIYADILMLLERDTPRAMLISLGAVVLLLFIHFKRLRDILWILAPVTIGFIWLMGIARLTGFKFNYLNVTVLPSILGVGIDNGIYIFHQYKEERKSSFFNTMQKTGKAVILSSGTTMVAFASLFFARHRGMASVGQLGFLGFACCLVTSVIFIPTLIEFCEMKYGRSFRYAKEPQV